MIKGIETNGVASLAIPLTVKRPTTAIAPLARPAAAITQVQHSRKSAIEVGAAISRVNMVFQVTETSLRFFVDDSSGSIVVQIINQETGEVLREIPQEKVEQLTEYFGKMIGLLIDKEA